MANPLNPNFSLDIVKHVICLNGTNFTPYKHNMNMIFRLKGLNGFVEGRVPKPEPVLLQYQELVQDAGAGVVPPPVPVITNAVAINDWEVSRATFQDILTEFGEAVEMGHRGEHNEVPFQLKMLVTVWWLGNQKETFRQIADRFSTTRGIH
ncbi:hypothetical protein DAPPUDRAFT_329389 [Daphnia pulex]|uniref:Uncharacterized protein n=1 Tax=Daphnia pulex TaxID=6669 RepID=E9HGF7_DAPPU|nr:hypothetical protein DAPPUDRAFT_329389 [Daphnia pulex]|eukprot:EFX69177.1 hypothetical protein DAPPUDRAFT_329389 [Daphnia pulex]